MSALFEKTFAPANLHKFPSFQINSSNSKYRSKVLDDCLNALFPSEQRIIDLTKSDHPIDQSSKVAVLTSSATGRKVLFSNYRRKASSKRVFQPRHSRAYRLIGYSTLHPLSRHRLFNRAKGFRNVRELWVTGNI